LKQRKPWKRRISDESTKILQEKGLFTKTPALDDTHEFFLQITQKGFILLENLTIHLEFALRQQNLI